MNKLKNFFWVRLLIPAICLPLVAGAGGWASSGGELFKDSHNPWFLKNVNEVTYCLELDQNSFSATTDTVEASLAQAIDYWRAEFTRNHGGIWESSDGRFRVGMQRFTKQDCTETTDIRFLLGYGTLNQQEREYLKEPEKFLGVTVRTEYDEENLRGRGFVYISSDLGDHAYHNPGSLISEAWKNQKLLTYVLIHELGHIFGLPHVGSGIMSEVAMDLLLNKALYSVFLASEIESFFHPSNEIKNCMMVLGPMKEFFEVPSNEQGCLSFQDGRQVGKPAGLWNVYWESVENKPVLLGRIKGVQPGFFDFQEKSGIMLHLNPNQKVFTPKETAFRSFMIGPSLINYGSQGIFLPKKGAPKSVYVKITPNTMTVTGNVGRKLEPVFIYNSLLGYALTIPPKP